MFIIEELANYYDGLKEMNLDQLIEEADLLFAEQSQINADIEAAKKRLRRLGPTPAESDNANELAQRHWIISKKVYIMKRFSEKFGCTF